MATQSPKTRKTKTTKKTASKAKVAAKKPVKTTPKVAKKPTVAAANAKTSRVKLSRVFRRKQRGASINTSRTPKASVVSLNAWNKWLALLFAVQGFAILLVSGAHSLPVVGRYLALDTFASQGQDEIRVPAQQHLFDVNVAYWLAGISLVFALGHLLAALALRRQYDAQIATGNSKLRWATFALGYGGLAVLFGLLVGINDVASLAVGFFLAAAVCVLASASEVLGAQARVIKGILVAAFIVGWAVLAYYLLNAWLYDGSIQAYLYILLGVSFLLSLQLGLVFLNQQKAEGKWADYASAERAYVTWTFVLVAAATWQIFLGVLQP